MPVYFDGPMASELLKDLMCSCGVRNICSGTTCICFQCNLPCIDICACNADERCANVHTVKAQLARNDMEDDE